MQQSRRNIAAGVPAAYRKERVQWPQETLKGIVRRGVAAKGNRIVGVCRGLQNNKQAHRVHIPASAQSIGCGAFYKCENLQKVTFAAGCNSRRPRGPSGERTQRRATTAAQRSEAVLGGSLRLICVFQLYLRLLNLLVEARSLRSWA